ncbi:nuclear transport factor 2 family protein [Saccharothrix longispora]|uniref:YybH family protein n=1 Tax=Saccharothrix longispora TaxID=33920 RepID=UPI0028FD50C2|nr:nuclear transport factor 2 family protein [Saccharothrix longispora]MDU0287707.1 nuclear transport factor 2 family protein [Saccharothrix longispora]
MTAQLDLDNLELTDDPEVQNAVFLAAFNSGKGAIFDSLYRDDAISNLTGTARTGADRTAAITELLARNPKLDSTVKYAYVAGGHTSLIVVDFRLEVTDDDGKPVRINGICTDVLIRKPDGKWIMAVDRPVALETIPL